MNCGYCQFSNSEEDHRCRRCGRRLSGTAVAAPAHLAREHVRLAVEVLGANALAASRAVATEERPVDKPRPARRVPAVAMDTAATLGGLPRPRGARAAQPSLFGAELQPKIIPFETLPRTFDPIPSMGEDREPPPAVKSATSAKRVVKPHAKRTAEVEDPQATLDFLPPMKSTSRTLKTNAEAVIFCDAVVAAPIHRATAAALDMSMILLAFASVMVIFQVVAKPVNLDRTALLWMGAMFGITALFYGLLFAVAGSVTPGMKWTHLRLINFDGFPLDERSRAVRFVGSWICFLSGGIGLIWALLDEENLTWHDHMSKTFPTLRESESSVVRQRNR